MYDEGLIPEESESIDSIKYLLSIKYRVEESKMSGWRKEFNTIWSDLYRRNKNDANIVCDYMHHFYQELLYNHNNNIIYIDTDSIILSELTEDIKKTIDGLNLTYEVVNVNHFYLTAKKRYAYTHGNVIKHKGFSPRRDVSKMLNIESIMKSHIRESKLERIGL